MEILGLLSIPDWLLILCIIIGSLYLYSSWNYGFWESQNVNTIRPLPFLGSLGSMMSGPAYVRDRENTAKYGSIYGLYEFRRPYLMVTDLELSKDILIKDFEHFVDRRKMPLGGKAKLLTRQFLTNLCGDEWKSARAVLSPTFTSGKLRQMGGLMEESARKMLQSCYDDINKQDGIINFKEYKYQNTVEVRYNNISL